MYLASRLEAFVVRAGCEIAADTADDAVDNVFRSDFKINGVPNNASVMQNRDYTACSWGWKLFASPMFPFLLLFTVYFFYSSFSCVTL